MKLPSGEYHRTSLMVLQHWSRSQYWPNFMLPYGVTRQEWVNTTSLLGGTCYLLTGMQYRIHKMRLFIHDKIRYNESSQCYQMNSMCPIPGKYWWLFVNHFYAILPCLYWTLQNLKSNGTKWLSVDEFDELSCVIIPSFVKFVKFDWELQVILPS